MSRISRAELERIARLARLRLDDGEAEAMTRQLESILGYVAQLEAVDTAGVKPTASPHGVALATPMRDDVPDPAVLLAPEVVVALAPAARGSAISVPRVLDDEAEG
jgi:aspartyl-tRNA(Asn)/glutamyl-tRNA(Gln) amidotransferase subunit C